jgi:hypothetical protein
MRDDPWLRTFYLKWPWPHFYEVPKSIAMVAIVRNDIDKDAIVILKIGAADELSLADVEVCIRRGKNAALDDVPSIKRALRVTRWPLPLRRLVWALGLNIGRQRANYFGTFGITSIASRGSENVVAHAPGPNLVSYGLVRADHTMELLFHAEVVVRLTLLALVVVGIEGRTNGDGPHIEIFRAVAREQQAHIKTGEPEVTVGVPQELAH